MGFLWRFNSSAQHNLKCKNVHKFINKSVLKKKRKMKEMRNKSVIILLLLALIILAVNVHAAVPKIEPYVNDFANILTPDEEAKLNLMCDAIEKNTSYEIAIVTVQSTEGQDRTLYANKIGDENGVGKKGKDNGIVVLWSLDNEAGGAIATGRYSESILNDAKVVRIGKAARPLFDQGKYYDAFTQIVMDINKELINSQDGSVNATSTGSTSGSGLSGDKVVLLILILGVIFWIMSKLDILDIFTGVAIGSVLSSGTGGKSRSSGGGGSFGGGSFGGGGGKF